MRIAELALEALRADGILTGDEAPRPIRLVGVRAEKLARAEDGVQRLSSNPSSTSPPGGGRGIGGAEAR